MYHPAALEKGAALVLNGITTDGDGCHGGDLRGLARTNACRTLA